MIERLADLRRQIDFMMSPIAQWLVADLLAAPEWPAHLEQLRAALRVRCDTVAATLTDAFGPMLHFTAPAEGLTSGHRGPGPATIVAASPPRSLFAPGRLYGT